MSNVSTRAMMNSPWGGAGVLSTDGSRRNSLNDAAQSVNASFSADTGFGGKMSNHLSRLHKKAQDQQAIAAASLGKQPIPHGHTNPPEQRTQALSGSTSRRASDPVRALDRNFGVVGGSQSSSKPPHRSGSFGHVNDPSVGSGRIPVHGQPYHQESFVQPHPARPASVGQFGAYHPSSQYNNAAAMQSAGFQQHNQHPGYNQVRP